MVGGRIESGTAELIKSKAWQLGGKVNGVEATSVAQSVQEAD